LAPRRSWISYLLSKHRPGEREVLTIHFSSSSPRTPLSTWNGQSPIGCKQSNPPPSFSGHPFQNFSESLPHRAERERYIGFTRLLLSPKVTPFCAPFEPRARKGEISDDFSQSSTSRSLLLCGWLANRITSSPRGGKGTRLPFFSFGGRRPLSLAHSLPLFWPKSN